MEKIPVATDAKVGNQDETGEFQVIDCAFHVRMESQMVKSILGERFDGDGSNVIISGWISK